MTTWKFDALLQNDTWVTPAFVSIDDQGKIQNIATQTDKDYEEVRGVVLPGYQNAHSHAFQYAMAGTAEHLPIGAKSDDFWSWREAMYNLALHVNPENVKNIAAMLYSEMLRHGYTSVAEFHYVHHDRDGKAYSNLAEMGEKLVAAAKETGICITLVPIFYQMGDFGCESNPRQKRFISVTVDDYFALYESSKKAVRHYNRANIAVGVHSLRAVRGEDIVNVFHSVEEGIPRHIHVSEQQKEVDSCINYLQKRPVEWLLDNVNLNSNYHLVHATHLDKSEVTRLAKSQAHVVLCPSTEGNLGDGLFSLHDFWRQGGRWSIGTDSHIGINPNEELRILDYGQRLHLQKRNILCKNEGEDSGELAFKESIVSGRRAMGNYKETFFTLGESFDAVVVCRDYPLLQTTSLERFLSTIVYASDCSAILGTIVNGKWIVKQQRHVAYDQIKRNFCQTVQELKNR